MDGGDTPAFRGVFEAAGSVVGATLVAVDALMRVRHGARSCRSRGCTMPRGRTRAGFCVFNDCGVAIEQLRARHGLRRIAYVDIDAHHGDGVFYAFEEDAELIFADIHEDGRDLYPGTGAREETGRGAAAAPSSTCRCRPVRRMLILPRLARGGGVARAIPREFILFQCGADSLAGDPITHLRFSEAAHAHAARRLGVLADQQGHGRVLGMGGGGYNRRNLARAWTAVVQAFAESH